MRAGSARSVPLRRDFWAVHTDFLPEASRIPSSAAEAWAMASFKMRNVIRSVVRGATGSVGVPQLVLLAASVAVGGAAIAGPSLKHGGQSAQAAKSPFSAVVLAKPIEAIGSEDHPGRAPVG